MRLFKLTSLLLVLTIISQLSSVYGQQTPLSPVSYRIFNPIIFNPAITGSKDFLSVDIIAAWAGESTSQLLGANARLLKKGPEYYSAPKFKEYSKFGVGGYLFNESYDGYSNSGIAGSASFQIPLNVKSLSFISFGAAVKGVYSRSDSVTGSDPALGRPPVNIFYPNVDAGIYYYGPNLFAGVSATNILGNPEEPDSTGLYSIKSSRQYFFQAGYKFVISKSWNMVIEPSIMVNGDDSLLDAGTEILKPMLKLYLFDFCLGTYFNDYKNISFFFQYRYPSFYVGTYVEIPKGTPYYKSHLNVELTFGIVFRQSGTLISKKNHW